MGEDLNSVARAYLPLPVCSQVQAPLFPPSSAMECKLQWRMQFSCTVIFNDFTLSFPMHGVQWWLYIVKKKESNNIKLF